MTNNPEKDLLDLARTGMRHRLMGLGRRTETFTPTQLALMSSLLDEFARKSKRIRNDNEEH
ncbi:hypothetical protein [Rhodococcus marinonascens]|uniref:hypothetical protein n=1 Tax=Rhodococcus marinonascens TaxID=38311 RepID=UPI000932BA12|nr:hypothetical protein [Rhodococcus marinonascens]